VIACLAVACRAEGGSTIYPCSIGLLNTLYTQDDNGQQLIIQTFSSPQGRRLGIDDFFDPKYPFPGFIDSAALDFDLASIPPGRVPASAILTVYVPLAWSNSSQSNAPVNISSNLAQGADLHMGLYAGFSQASLADFSAANIGTYTQLNQPYGDPAIADYSRYIYPLNFDVTGFVSTLLQQGDQCAGFQLLTDPNVIINGPDAISFSNDWSGLLQPTLTIDGPPPFTAAFAPEPSSWLLLATGVSVVVLIRARGGLFSG
jgi:hypothetical protein